MSSLAGALTHAAPTPGQRQWQQTAAAATCAPLAPPAAPPAAPAPAHPPAGAIGAVLPFSRHLHAPSLLAANLSKLGQLLDSVARPAAPPASGSLLPSWGRAAAALGVSGAEGLSDVAASMVLCEAIYRAEDFGEEQASRGAKRKQQHGSGGGWVPAVLLAVGRPPIRGGLLHSSCNLPACQTPPSPLSAAAGRAGHPEAAERPAGGAAPARRAVEPAQAGAAVRACSVLLAPGGGWAAALHRPWCMRPHPSFYSPAALQVCCGGCRQRPGGCVSGHQAACRPPGEPAAAPRPRLPAPGGQPCSQQQPCCTRGGAQRLPGAGGGGAGGAAVPAGAGAGQAPGAGR